MSTSFPLPGSTLDGRIVVASTYLNDDCRQDFPDAAFDELALVLLLNDEPPYFTTTQITKDGDGPWCIVPDSGSTEYNIVEIVGAYEQEGGDM